MRRRRGRARLYTTSMNMGGLPIYPKASSDNASLLLAFLAASIGGPMTFFLGCWALDSLPSTRLKTKTILCERVFVSQDLYSYHQCYPDISVSLKNSYEGVDIAKVQPERSSPKPNSMDQYRVIAWQP